MPLCDKKKYGYMASEIKCKALLYECPCEFIVGCDFPRNEEPADKSKDRMLSTEDINMVEQAYLEVIGFEIVIDNYIDKLFNPT